MYGNDVEILDSLFNDYNTSHIKHLSVAFLGRSLEVLAQADVAFFSSGWKSARDCRIEYDVARLYGIRVTGDESWFQNADPSTQTLTDGVTVTSSTVVPQKCRENDCAVWYDGRCHYNK